jgi:hypothetical protein
LRPSHPAVRHPGKGWSSSSSIVTLSCFYD